MTAKALIQQFEGLSLDAYKCPAGVWTIGWGHTGKDVTPGLRITREEAERLLDLDMQKISKRVFELLSVPLRENEFAALVSFAYNVGVGNFRSSTLLGKINRRDPKAAEEFGRWVYCKGKVSDGLVRRRQAECALFLS